MYLRFRNIIICLTYPGKLDPPSTNNGTDYYYDDEYYEEYDYESYDESSIGNAVPNKLF